MHNPFENTGMEINGLLFLSPREAYEVSEEGAIFVDIRESYETSYKAFGVKNVLYRPYSKFKNELTDLPVDKYLVIADSSGNKLRAAMGLLREQGYNKTAGLNGGIFDWERDGLPMKFDKGESLTGSCTCTLKPRKRFNSFNGRGKSK